MFVFLTTANAHTIFCRLQPLLQLADFVTSETFARNALCAAFAAGMYGLGDSGFGTLKAYALAQALSLTLKILDAGGENAVDTLMDDKVATLTTLAGLYLVYA